MEPEKVEVPTAPTQPTSRVFIANQANLDYAKAEKFGTLVPITKHFVRFDDIDGLTTKISRLLDDTMPHTDYLVLSGNNLVCAIVLHLWLKRHAYARILHWDTRNERYVIVTIGAYARHILIGEYEDLEAGVEVSETRPLGDANGE